MSPSLKSAQPGRFSGRSGRRRFAGAKKNTSWRVGKMRLPTSDGNIFGSQGPQAKT
jgi:hypothetical protein